jgi:hypothetical protein
VSSPAAAEGVAPSAPTVVSPRPETYQVPSLEYRILAAALRLIPLLILFVGLPVAVLNYLSSRQVSLPVSVVTVETFGIAIAVLSTARYIAKPTRAYGPVSMATSAVALAYLFTLWLEATYRIMVPSSAVTISIGYGGLIDLLLAVPALALLAGLVTTVEDFRSPTERLPFDFPA